MTAALYAVTMQVPPVFAVNTPAVMAQLVAVPFVTVKVTAPVPEPPLAAKVRGASR